MWKQHNSYLHSDKSEKSRLSCHAIRKDGIINWIRQFVNKEWKQSLINKIFRSWASQFFFLLQSFSWFTGRNERPFYRNWNQHIYYSPSTEFPQLARYEYYRTFWEFILDICVRMKKENKSTMKNEKKKNWACLRNKFTSSNEFLFAPFP